MNKEDYLEFLNKSAELREKLDGMEFESLPEDWLVKRGEYKSADEVIEDLLYLTAENVGERLNAVDLDKYFYKRQYLQNQLKKFYADKYVLVDKFCKPQKSFNYNPEAEGMITELANSLDCYVVLKKGDMYFIEVGDEIIELGDWPNINKLNESK